MLTILFDGVAYGMLLFVLACGLAITLGLMNFVNLAHGTFAMVGGYVTVLAMSKLGLPYLYLGYWVQGSRKMSYKARFLPQERLTMDGWVRHL